LLKHSIWKFQRLYCGIAKFYPWLFAEYGNKGKTVNIFEDLNIMIFFHPSRTQIQEHLFFTCIFLCESSCDTFFYNKKSARQKLNTQLMSNIIILLSNFSFRLYYYWCFSPQLFFVFFCIVRNFFAFIFQRSCLLCTIFTNWAMEYYGNVLYSWW